MRFDAAIAFSLSNDKSATYKQLFKISKKGIFDDYTNYENIVDEEAFEIFHNDLKFEQQFIAIGMYSIAN